MHSYQRTASEWLQISTELSQCNRTKKQIAEDKKVLYRNVHTQTIKSLHDLRSEGKSKSDIDKDWKTYKYNSTIASDNKVGRNDPCPCGSNRKFKKCCRTT
jgi:uncharacterized protein YchJ